MIIRELITRLGFQTDAAKIDSFDSRIGALQMSLGGLIGGLTAAGASVLAMAKMTASAGGQILESSMKMGISTDTYQELDHAAKMAGASMGTVGVAMRSVSSLMEQAKKPGSEASKTFRKLGIDVKELGSADKAIEIFADKIAALPNGMEKTALATKLMGRGGKELIPLLNEGSAGIRKMRQDAIDLGLVMSEDVIKAGDDLGDALDTVEEITRSFSRTVGGAAIPLILEMVDGFIEWVKVNNKLIRQNLVKIVTTATRAVGDMVKWVRALYDRLAPLVDAMGGWEATIKRVAVALGLLLLAKVAADIFMLYKDVVLITKAFWMLGKSLAAANASTIGLVLLGLALVAAALAIEDIYGYIKGDDSLVGRFLKQFEGADGAIGATNIALREFLRELGILRAGDYGEVRIAFHTDAEMELDLFQKMLAGLDKMWTFWTTRLPLGIAIWEARAKGAMKSVAEAVTFAVDAISSAWDALVRKLSSIWDSSPALRAAVDTIGAVSKMNAIGGIQAAGRGAATLGEFSPGAFVGAARDSMSLGTIGGAIAGGKYLSPYAAGAGLGQLAVQAGGVVVNVTHPGATANEIAAKVKEAQEEGIGNILRTALRNVFAGEE